MKKIIYLAAVILAVSLLLCSCMYEPTVNENVGAADTPGEEDNNGVTDKEEAPSVPEVEVFHNRDASQHKYILLLLKSIRLTREYH